MQCDCLRARVCYPREKQLDADADAGVWGLDVGPLFSVRLTRRWIVGLLHTFLVDESELLTGSSISPSASMLWGLN